MKQTRITHGQALDFLAARYGAVGELEPLAGGFWSSAYAFSHDGRALVVRFGEHRDWFEADRAAVQFGSRHLPVPEVVDVGSAFDGAYAISERRFGINLEDVPPDKLDAAGPMLASLLGALYQVPTKEDLPVVWHSAQVPADLTWRQWLHESLQEGPASDGDGWRATIAGMPEIDRILRAASARIDGLIDACPERRDLVHGDLLHANVLVTEDATAPTAVFSWKCSVRGDFLYDTAWCTFWSAWYPGIVAAHPWTRVQREPCFQGDTLAWADAPMRHHCYELHIGIAHLGWNVWVGDDQELQRVAQRLDEVLERGPLRAD